MNTFLKNYLSTLAFILIGYFFYSNIPYYQNFFTWEFHFLFFSGFTIKAPEIFQFILLWYTIGLIPFYIFHKEKGKALIILEYIAKKIKNTKTPISQKEKISVLAWGVKIFYAPLLIMWLLWYSSQFLNNIFLWGWGNIFKNSFLVFFDNNLFWTLFAFFFLIDTFFFACGYLFESPFLKNTIKSVDMTLSWWLVTLICYPPLSGLIGTIIPWYSENFPKFENTFFHIFWGFLFLIFLGIYAWASFALGLKASNLTNRGIIKTWPYKFVRHPAYSAKNIAWWIWASPAIFTSFEEKNIFLFLLIVFSLSFWSFIYFLRAITEERHLSQDPDYKKYQKEVPYRFIPKIY